MEGRTEAGPSAILTCLTGTAGSAGSGRLTEGAAGADAATAWTECECVRAVCTGHGLVQ